MYFVEDFKKNGYAGPFPLFDKQQADKLLAGESPFSDLLLPVVKARHVINRDIAKLALSEDILKRITPLLGENILLSGSQIIHQKPETMHEWHVDIEHQEWNGITIWIGLKNVKRKECIKVITRSHKINVTPDHLKQNDINICDDDAVLNYVKQLSPEAELVNLDISDGEFFIFEGRTWHATNNSTNKERHAIILQYCNTHQKVKSLNSLLLPQVVWKKTSPQCLLISGTDDLQINRIIPFEKINSFKTRLKSVFIYLPKNIISKRKKIVSVIKACL